jgi:nitroreductase
MDIPFSKWYAVVNLRRSRRLFDSTPIPPDILDKLKKVCEEFRPFHEVRSVLMTASADDVFKGFLSHYGKIKGTPAFIGFIGEKNEQNVHEKVGYTGEGIILEATAMNLGTCWVGGFFKPDVAASLVNTRETERVFAITPVGYAAGKVSLEEKIMSGFGRTHLRKPLKELITGIEEAELPLWMKNSLEAARLAPSAVNRQPWRFYLTSSSITVSVDDVKDTYNIPKRIDCGIAMLHIEVAALYHGKKGRWTFLDPPDVARFTV